MLVQAANSGHPGIPMALAPVAYCLGQRFLCFDPENPIWPNRDRFVLSTGCASMLLYALLYLTGVRAVNADYERFGEPSVTLDDIRRIPALPIVTPFAEEEVRAVLEHLVAQDEALRLSYHELAALRAAVERPEAGPAAFGGLRSTVCEAGEGPGEDL